MAVSVGVLVVSNLAFGDIKVLINFYSIAPMTLITHRC